MIAWDPEFATPYESPWGIIQKLSWLNHIKPVQVIRLLTDLHIPEGRPDPPFRRLLDASWMINNEVKEDVVASNGKQGAFPDLATSLCARDGKRQFGRFANALLSPRWVRICPDCAHLGYHSIVHQMRSMEYCPIHHTALTERCPACRSPMPYFGIGKASTGWRCGDCGTSWLGDDNTLRPASDVFRNEIEKTIGNIVHWVQSLLELPYQFREHCLSDGFDSFLRTSEKDDDGSYTTYNDASIWFLHQVGHFPLSDCLLCEKPIGIRCTVDGEILKMGSFPNAGDLDEISSYRGLVQCATQYVEQYLRIRHSHCFDDCKELDIYGPSYDQRCRLGVGLCPAVHAYFIWRKCSFAWTQTFISSIFDSRRIEYILGPGKQKRYLEWNNLLSSYYAWVQSVIIMQSRFKRNAKHNENIIVPDVRLNPNPWLRKYFCVPYDLEDDIPKVVPQVVLEDFDAISCSRCHQGVAIREWLKRRWDDRIMRVIDIMERGRSKE